MLEMGKRVNHHIIIIGGGAVGAVMLHRLIVELAQQPSGMQILISVVEASGRFGPGLAYSTPLNSHRLNMCAGSMSAKPEAPDDFVCWANANKSIWAPHEKEPDVQREDYPPRRVYGLYLENLIEEARGLAASRNIEINLVQGEAIAAVEDLNSIQVQMDTGRTVHGDHVILCMGNQAPEVCAEFCSHSGYFHTPWPASKFADVIPPDVPLVILGSGLTAIDTLFTLLDQGHVGKITFVSRNGLLPKVQSQGARHELSILNFENILVSNYRYPISLEHVGGLLRREIEQAEGPSFNFDEELRLDRPVSEALRRDIQNAKSGNLRYQAVLYATADIIGKLWNLLPTQEQQCFEAAYASIWKIFRHPMPVMNADRVLEALDLGMLNVVGGLESITSASSKPGFVLQLATDHSRNPGGIRYIDTRFMINATGQGFNLTRLSSALIRFMVAHRSLMPHPSGGISVDYYSGRTIGASGRKSQRLYAVGPLTKGVHFYTNALGENVKCAARTARYITRQICASASREDLAATLL